MLADKQPIGFDLIKPHYAGEIKLHPFNLRNRDDRYLYL